MCLEYVIIVANKTNDILLLVSEFVVNGHFIRVVVAADHCGHISDYHMGHIYVHTYIYHLTSTVNMVWYTNTS